MEYPKQCVLSRETVQDIEDLLSGIVDSEIDDFELQPSENHGFLLLAKIFSELAKLKGETSYWKVEGIDENGKLAADGGNVEARHIWQIVRFCLANEGVIGVRIT